VLLTPACYAPDCTALRLPLHSAVFCLCCLLTRHTETLIADALAGPPCRTKLLNPKWYEGMLSSGYEGVREIQKRLTNTMGWSATSGTVDNWVYDEANRCQHTLVFSFVPPSFARMTYIDYIDIKGVSIVGLSVALQLPPVLCALGP